MFAVVSSSGMQKKKNNKKKQQHETVNTASANVTSLFITLPAPDDPANSNNSTSLCVHVHLNLCTGIKQIS